VGLRADLDRDGFAWVRRLLSPDEVARMLTAYERLEATARSLAGSSDVGQARFVVDAAPFRLHRVVWCGGAEPELAVYGDDPRFLGIAGEALGVDPVVQLIQQAHFKLPGDEVAFAWHQDASNRRYGTPLFTDVDGRGSFVQIAVALDPMGPDNGGLAMVPGTHRLGFVADPETGALPEGCFDAADAVCPSLEPGDALVFGPFVIHGSAPNRGSGPRRTFLQGYAAPGANHRSYPGCGLGVERSIFRKPS
jgi:ectoine hydroxylase-related dioxygenase (phytanoyl-CoA dioxygenase family)